MILSNNYKLNGHYIVGDEVIDSKMTAILTASEKNKPMTWWYYDEIYAAALKRFTDKQISTRLSDTYKQRALQLRDKYDYLILNYSGGSDSHNVLMTFLKNNIKLDHIYVQWPMALVDRGIYTPNNVDKSNFNFHSEWDLVLKKDLEWISSQYPEIVIEISDWTETVTENFYNDDLFMKSVNNLPSITRAQKQNIYSKTETELSLKGKKVASIYGVDKPNVIMHEELWYMYFVDTACMAQPNPHNPTGTEYFYFTPDMPEVAIHQAYVLADWYNKHIELISYVSSLSATTKHNSYMQQWFKDNPYKRYHTYSEHVKLACYPYWDFSRFQAEKPFSQLDNLPMGVRAWDNILLEIPNFTRVQQTWEYHWKSYFNKINPEYLRNQDTFAVFRSGYHPLYIPVAEAR